MRTRAVLVVIALLCVAAACGDDKSDQLTASEFKAQGNDICKKGGEELDAAASEVFVEGQEPDKEAVRTFLKDKAIPSIRQQIDDIDALEPPDELADRVDDMITEANKAIKKFEEAADAEDPRTTLDDSNDPFEATNKIATEVGLTVCAEA